ncbi:uncharacterized protein [Prorops nasuta]|uniref:uncharacterized protein n=1 Tax=Prorops nasuta TaxID=863751 RepID=UPI0034CF0355
MQKFPNAVVASSQYHQHGTFENRIIFPEMFTHTIFLPNISMPNANFQLHRPYLAAWQPSPLSNQSNPFSGFKLLPLPTFLTSSHAMEPAQENNLLYDLHHGQYCVRFSNRRGLSVKEITEIFSEFGKVTNVKIAGDDYGICFVKYGTADEASNCVKGLKNHKFINLLKPNKPKQNDNGCFNRDRVNARDYNKVNMRENLQNHNSFSSSKEASPNNSFMQCIKTKPAFNNFPNEEKHDTQNNQKCCITKLPNLLTSNTVPNKKFNLVITTDKPTSEKHENNEVIAEDDIPSPVTLKKTVKAQEIIVANIPSDFDENYILYLFRSYKPIAATFVKIIPKTLIQYCVIYFKTDEEAVKIEQKFNYFPLAGKNLIVLRKVNLIANIV